MCLITVVIALLRTTATQKIFLYYPLVEVTFKFMTGKAITKDSKITSSYKKQTQLSLNLDFYVSGLESALFVKIMHSFILMKNMVAPLWVLCVYWSA